jgi:hypothetical protein
VRLERRRSGRCAASAPAGRGGAPTWVGCAASHAAPTWTRDDVVLACHVLSYTGTWTGPHGGLEQSWVDALDAVPAPRSGERVVVGHPEPRRSNAERVRFARLDVFRIHPA